MIETIKNLFKKKHKHVWENKTFLNEEHSMYWRVRYCKCGTVEILNAGGLGDGKWHPFAGDFRFDWEKKWFEAAKVKDFEKDGIKYV